MNEKDINDICWWIPIKKLRNNIRNVLYDIKNTNDIIMKKYSNDSFLYSCKLDDISFAFYDLITSDTVKIVENEIEAYKFDIIDFKEGDIIIDIGANIGITSIYLAKKYPFVKIYSFEPVKQNYDNLLKNIELNNIDKNIIKAHNMAVTKDGRDVNLSIPLFNTGASNIYNNNHGRISNININVKSITLNDIFSKYNINKCKLLKIDCEGSEYEILYNTDISYLKNCENIRGEFHGDIDEKKELFDYCKKYIHNIEIDL